MPHESDSARLARITLKDRRTVDVDALYDDVVHILRRDGPAAPPTALPVRGGGSLRFHASDVLAVFETRPVPWPWPEVE
jgi:hypothetical protein